MKLFPIMKTVCCFLFVLLFPLSSAWAVTEQERVALMALYDGTDGANWNSQNGWGVDANPCNWAGITCDEQLEIINIYLANNNMSGSIPAGFTDAVTAGAFAQLQELSFRNNNLSGDIPPQFGSLSELRVLNLSTNQFGGALPGTLGSLSKLQELILYENQLGEGIANPLLASIPPGFGDLGDLRILRLDVNSLKGSIPSSLGNLNNLVHLSLASNQLSGEIPVEIADLANLQILNLRSNELAGAPPPELGRLEKLEILRLNLNRLEGSLPEEWGNLGVLQELALTGNAFTGRIPDSYEGLVSLAQLGMHYNGIYRENDALLERLNQLHRRDDILSTQTLDPENLMLLDVGDVWAEFQWDPVVYTQAGGYLLQVTRNSNLTGGWTGLNQTKEQTTMRPAALFSCTVYYARVMSYTDPHLPSNKNEVRSDGKLSDVVNFMTKGADGCSPAIVAGGGVFEISESAPLGTVVTTMESLDSDEGDSLSYSITKGNDQGDFDIDTASGELTVAAPLDYESKTDYELTVQVEDTGGNFDTSVVTVNIIDVAENGDPVFTGGTGDVDVAEDTPVNTVITTLQATDPDGDNISFSLTAGNEDGKFAMDANSGEIHLAAGLDFETTSNYVLTVQVADGNSGTASADIIINVTDVDEPPLLSGDNGAGGKKKGGGSLNPLLLLLLGCLYGVIRKGHNPVTTLDT